MQYSQKVNIDEIVLTSLSGEKLNVPSKFYYLTCHREENTNDDRNLLEILKAMEQLDSPTIYPVHPRNRARAQRLNDKYHLKNILLVEPVGYLESVCLVNNSIKIVTDSGGLQREAFFAKKKCVTILDFVCWPETMVEGRNELSKPDSVEILEKLKHEQKVNEGYEPFGDGHAASKIVYALENLK